MSLARLQAELAALLMEPGRLEEFEREPRAYARRAGLTGKHADLLAGLPVEGARYFAQRRRIDRFGYLRGDLPRSIALLGRGGLEPYFAAHPYAFEKPMREVAQFSKWARTAPLPQAVKDVIAVESAAVRLMHGPHRAPTPTSRPKRAPGVRLVRVAHDPRHFFHDHPWTPTPGRFTAVLQRTADDVEAPSLKAAELDALAAADGRRTPAQLAALLAKKGHPRTASAAALRRLRRLGLVAWS